MQDTSLLSQILVDLFARRATVDSPLTSVRAQASIVGISAPQMSRIRNGKVPLTLGVAKKIAYAIGQTPEERQQILATLEPYYAEKRGHGLPSRKELEVRLAHHEQALIHHQEMVEALRLAIERYDDWEILKRTLDKIQL